jgi:hypothetical protein
VKTVSHRDRRSRLLAAAVVGLLLAAACSSEGPSRTIQLETLNASGVTGTVRLVEIGTNQTRVEVRVQPGANPDMPAHIHPGGCDDLQPQPKYPLQNVVSGSSTTVVPASLTELMAGDLAVNLHRSNDDLATYTACADLR